MIHRIDHDRIQSCSAGALEKKKKKKLFGGVFVRVGWHIQSSLDICLSVLVLGRAEQRWRELWQKSDYEDWLYRRPQLPADATDDEDDCNSIYELPERVSSSRPISTYYSSATILASDSAVYSAYY